MSAGDNIGKSLKRDSGRSSTRTGESLNRNSGGGDKKTSQIKKPRS
jgi:hypothetical protein